jgi:hypothetical protein
MAAGFHHFSFIELHCSKLAIKNVPARQQKVAEIATIFQEVALLFLTLTGSLFQKKALTAIFAVCISPCFLLHNNEAVASQLQQKSPRDKRANDVKHEVVSFLCVHIHLLLTYCWWTKLLTADRISFGINIIRLQRSVLEK